jgi:phosphonate transport system substrate-binding protein
MYIPAAVFNDARNTVKKDQPNVFKDTRILKLTQAIPNDTISVRPDMDKDCVNFKIRVSLNTFGWSFFTVLRASLNTAAASTSPISVRPDMDKDFQEKLKKAFIDIAKSKEGHKIISEVYSHDSLTMSKFESFVSVYPSCE